MSTIHFYKMHGAGNDFVLIDGRLQSLPQNVTTFIQHICKRHTGVGADGLMIIDHHPDLDFRLSYFNADGSVGEMCGNGARCAAALAYRLEIAGAEMEFEIQGVNYRALVEREGQVRIAMQPAVVLKQVEELEHLLVAQYRSMLLLEVGVPHLIVEVDADLDKVDVEAEGQRLRYHPDFSPRGCNVNFVYQETGKLIHIRTYERGVEAETLACGTGAVAAATYFNLRHGLSWPLQVNPPGGLLKVEKVEAGCSLTGPAILVYEGQIQSPADGAS